MSRISERVIILFCVGIVFLILLPVCRAEGASENEPNLLKLAMKKFPTLTKDDKELEKLKKLLHAVVNGELADYSDKSGKNNDPNEAKDEDPNTGVLKWDPNTRVIRAKCVVWLCTDPEASAMVTYKGILIKGARIKGELDLSDARISFPLRFNKSAFPDGINLRYAEIRNLNLEGTYTGPIYGSGLKVNGNFFLRNRFQAKGKVKLEGARIEGNLDCEKSRFIEPNGRALDGGRLNIEGNVYLRNGFKAEGEVRFGGATIGGNLDCNGGQFINKGAKALYAYGANIKGDVLLRDGFKAEGEVYLMGVTIGRDLDCSDGNFIDPKALSADSIDVKGNVFLRNDFHADGKVSLIGATIGGYFKWRDVNSPSDVTLDLRYASVGILNDEANSWPDPNKLFLYGLEYKDLAAGASKDAKSRIKWLRRQSGFWPQPYEQLAEVFRKGGQDEDAKKILIWKNEDRARLTELTTWSEIIWYRVLGPRIGYGYQPLNALWWVAAFVALGSFLFGIGYWGGIITPQSESAYVEGDTGIAIPGDDDRYLSDVYPRFNFLVYSFDTFVPLIDLHQSKYWLPNANRGNKLLRIKGFSLHTGGLLRFYLWIHLTMGWLLSMLLVVGLTGLVRT